MKTEPLFDDILGFFVPVMVLGFDKGGAGFETSSQQLAVQYFREIHNESLSEHSLEKNKDESNKKVGDTVLTRENDESNTNGCDSVFIEDGKREEPALGEIAGKDPRWKIIDQVVSWSPLTHQARESRRNEKNDPERFAAGFKEIRGIKIESECSNHAVDDNMKETCGSSWSDPSTQQKNVGDNCAASDFRAPISDHPSADPNLECYSDHQIRNYNELLKQYYELEQKKEKIAEQLWSANYWNYQIPAQSSTSQEQQVPVSRCSELSSNISCPWCTCQCLTNTSTSISACPVANTLCTGYACCPQQMCCFGSQVQQEAGGFPFSPL
ncbi:hypothetical protein KSP40_PGU020781 [Platanthera guangdongensis]|uniref:Uncharacterized protein n=1 Tax=Platanthera guangdongensis TaxID=2320717 RepID=A0ABR2ML25_9ASPA